MLPGRQMTYWQRYKMKFLADMCISVQTVIWLRSLGYDAIHLYEEDLQTLPDCDVMHKAKQEKRVLLTMDLDFARLVAASSISELPTIVIFRLKNQRPAYIQSRLSVAFTILKNLSSNESAILSVSDKNIRIRKLPLK